MKTVLVTGASGFVGSHLTEELLKHGFRTIAAIRFSSSTKYLTHPEIIIYRLNLNDKEQLKNDLLKLSQQVGEIHYIIHNAGITKAKRLNDFWTHNFGTTKNLVDVITELQLKVEKFIYISSLAAYGAGNPFTLEPVKLTDIPNPQTEYGRSKLAAEEYVMENSHFPWIVFRPTGIYGPRDVDYFVFLKIIQRGFEPYVGFKTQHLTFIYIKDLVRLVVQALESKVFNKSYFVSDGNTYTSEEYADIVKKALNKKTFRIRVPLFMVKTLAYLTELIYKPFGVLPLLNKDKYYLLSSINWKCDIEQTITDFSFTPQYNLEKGVKESIQWYKENGWLN